MISSLFHRWHHNPYRHFFCNPCTDIRADAEYHDSACND